METAPIPEDEAERIRALGRYEAALGDADVRYEELVRLATHVTGASVGLVTAIGEDRLWVKASRNYEGETVERATSFCGHLVDEPDGMLVVEDAREDERFADNPLVAGDPAIRFYAGYPLAPSKDHVVGSLCVLDPETGNLDEEQRVLFGALGRQVMTNLVARRRIHELDERIRELSAD